MKDNNSSKIIKYISFIVYPWFSFLYSLKSLDTKSTYNVIFGFFVLFGLAFTPSLNSELDSAYYLDFFLSNRNVTSSQFFADFIDYISFKEGGQKDFFIHTITFFVSSFTQNFHFYFATFAAIFSIFYLKSFKFLTMNKEFETKDVICLFLAFMFTLSNPIFNINGVRFWTAAWLAIFITFKIILEGRKRFFLWALFLPLVHASFSAYLLLLVIYFFVKSKKILINGFFLSFFLSGLMITFLQDITSYLPPVLESLIKSYTSEGYVQFREEQVANLHWYIKVLNAMKIIYPNVLIIVLIKISGKFTAVKLGKLLSFILILAIFSNLTISIPSLGNRFMILLFPLIAVLWIYNKDLLKNYKWFIYLYPIIFVKELYLLYQNIMETIDPYFYLAPFFYFVYHIIQ